MTDRKTSDDGPVELPREAGDASRSGEGLGLRRGSSRGLHLQQVENGSDELEEVYGGVGADMRAERQRRRLSLADVSETLRIQQTYLSALEDGRTSDLPGPTYAIGFLRTYSEYLGLDGDEIVRQFKQEATLTPVERRLVFPEPLEEARRPGLSLALISLVVAGAVYGGWIFLERQDLVPIETVAEPPQRLAPYQAAKPEPKMPVTPEAATSATDNAFVDGAPKTVAANVGPDSTSDLKPDPATTSLPPATTMTSAAEKMPEQAAEQPVEKLAAGEGERAATADVRGMVHTSEQPGIVSPEGTPPTATREVAPTATTTVMSNTASAVAPTETVDVKKTPDAVEQAVAPVAPVASVATTDTTAVTPVAPVAREGSDVDTAPVMPSIQISVAPPPAPSTSLTPARPISEERGDAAADQNSNQDEGASSQADASDGLGYRPQIYGASNRDVRIVLRARAESWVQIQGAKNELLLTRMLRAGDSYRVPNRIDLVLMTGNAGAIEIIMDGVALGILGPIGQVRRNIKLNVDQLREQMQSTSRPSP